MYCRVQRKPFQLQPCPLKLCSIISCSKLTLKLSWFDLLQNCNPPHQWVFSQCAHPENIHTMYFPHKRDWNFLGGGRFCKTQKCKEMCDAIIIDMKWQVLLSLHCRMNATPSPPSFLPDPFSLKFPQSETTCTKGSMKLLINQNFQWLLFTLEIKFCCKQLSCGELFSATKH